MQLGETIPKLLPQPFRDVYNDYRILKNQDINNPTRLKAVQRIAENCFRLLLTIPLVALMRIGYAYAKPSSIAHLISLAIVISPSASILVGAGCCSILSISRVVSAVANKCIADVGGAFLAAMFAGFLSENYKYYEGSIWGTLEGWIEPASNKISKMIRPDLLVKVNDKQTGWFF